MGNKPKLFITCGYVASGKSTAADAVGKVTNSEIIRTDDVRKKLFPKEFEYGKIDLGNSESAKQIEAWIESNDPGIDFQQVLNPLIAFEGEAYVGIINKYSLRIKEQKEEVYDQAFAELNSVLAAGRDVLFDATFSSASMRERAYQIAIKNGVETVYVVQVVCDEAVVESRLTNRSTGKQITTSNAKQMSIFRKVKKEFDESRIQDDDSVVIKRILYDTGSQEIRQFGKNDKTTKVIKNVVVALSQKYGG
jgi:predicted kinase